MMSSLSSPRARRSSRSPSSIRSSLRRRVVLRARAGLAWAASAEAHSRSVDRPEKARRTIGGTRRSRERRDVWPLANYHQLGPRSPGGLLRSLCDVGRRDGRDPKVWNDDQVALGFPAAIAVLRRGQPTNRNYDAYRFRVRIHTKPDLDLHLRRAKSARIEF